MQKQRRWERDADRVRSAAPTWLDADRLPWWLFMVVGLGFLARGIYLLMADSTGFWERVLAAALLCFVVPAQFIAARRRWRGEPISDRRRGR